MKTYRSLASNIPPNARKGIVMISSLMLLAAIVLPFVHHYNEEMQSAQNYRSYQNDQDRLYKRFQIVKAEALRCLKASTGVDCIPKLKTLNDLIKQIPGEDRGEFDWWHMATLLQASNGIKDGKSHDSLIQRSYLYGYINDQESYLSVNDSDHSKFRSVLRNKLEKDK